jgi:hypothetical protein
MLDRVGGHRAPMRAARRATGRRERRAPAALASVPSDALASRMQRRRS